MSGGLLEPFVGQRVVQLETSKRDGTVVGTPVNMVVVGDRAYLGTPATAWKVRRMGNFPTVSVTACTLRGRTYGPTLRCRARLLAGEEAARANRVLRHRFPFVYGVLVPVEHALRRTTGLHYELADFTADPAPATSGSDATAEL